MERNLSQIQIKSDYIEIKGQNLSSESIQTILDFATIQQKNQMKQQTRFNLEAIVFGLMISIILGLTVNSLSINLFNLFNYSSELESNAK